MVGELISMLVVYGSAARNDVVGRFGFGIDQARNQFEVVQPVWKFLVDRTCCQELPPLPAAESVPL
jgi:hypothetical protein